MDAFVKENNGHKKVNIPQLQFPGALLKSVPIYYSICNATFPSQSRNFVFLSYV